jgi:hypothetical protein
MEERHAGGRNTQIGPSRAETLLESGLSEVTVAVSELMAQARAVDPAADEYGHARSRAYTDAVTLLKASARLGHTIAELRGTKFEHTINVIRQQGGATQESPAADEEEATLMSLDENTLWDWRKKRTYVLDPTRDPYGYRPGERPREGDPPCNFRRFEWELSGRDPPPDFRRFEWEL